MTESLSFSLDPRLKTKLFGTELPSPLILGSGTLAEHVGQIDPFLKSGAGAVIPRTTRKNMERKVHPSPHLYQTGPIRNETMINAEWTGAAIDYWRPYLEDLAKTKRIIMSISGRDISGCIDVCRELDLYGFPLMELNISCAHSNNIHGMITRNEEHIKKVIGGVKEAGVVTPLAIKLGHSDEIVQLSEIAKKSGADANVWSIVISYSFNGCRPYYQRSGNTNNCMWRSKPS